MPFKTTVSGSRHQGSPVPPDPTLQKNTLSADTRLYSEDNVALQIQTAQAAQTTLFETQIAELKTK